MANVKQVLASYLSSIKKLYYGVHLLIEKPETDYDVRIMYSNVIRNFIHSYEALIQLNIKIPDVQNYEHQEFSIIEGILYGNIDSARNFSNSAITSDDLLTFAIAQYLQYCIKKEDKSFIPYPFGYKNSTKSEGDIKHKSTPVLSAFDIVNTGFKLSINH